MPEVEPLGISVRFSLANLDIEARSDAHCRALLDSFPRTIQRTAVDEARTLRLDVGRSLGDRDGAEFHRGSHHFRRGTSHAWVVSQPRQLQTLRIGSPSEAALQLDGQSIEDGTTRARPAIDAISTWAASQGVVPVHASGIARGQDALLLVGEGGRGKTTTAMALAARGWNLLADDRSFLTIERQGVVASGFYRTAILTCDSANRFPEFIGEVLGMTQAGKVACRLPWTTPLVSNAVLRGAISLSRDEADPYRLRKVGTKVALRIWQEALIPTVQAIGPSPVWLGLLAEVSRNIPLHSMSIGWDLDRIEQILSTHIDQLKSPGYGHGDS